MIRSQEKPRDVVDEFFDQEKHPVLYPRLQEYASIIWGNRGIRSQIPLEDTAPQPDFRPIPAEGWNARDFLGELAVQVLPYAINTGSPYYMGHMCSLLPNFMYPLAALVTALNQNTVKLETSGMLTFYERQALAMLHELVYGLPAAFYNEHSQLSSSTLGIMTSGGTIANLTALLCARERIAKQDSTFPEIGAAAVICSRLAHYSIKKATLLFGPGVRLVEVDADHRQRVKLRELDREVNECRARGEQVIALVGVAGSTECGSIDPLNAMADLAAAQGIHFHVDAAWGGAALFSDQHRRLMRGIERADSVTLDGHKQLYLPMGTGMVFFKDPTMAGSIEQHAQYIIRRHSADLGKRSIEGSRPAGVFYLQAALKLLGKQGYAALIDASFENARLLADMIRDAEDFELLTIPATNIFLYRYLPAGYRNKKHFSPDEENHISLFNSELQERQFRKGKTFVSKTNIVLAGHGPGAVCALRAVISNPAVKAVHFKTLLDDQRQIAQEMESR